MIKTLFRSPVATAVLFIVAAALLLGGIVGAVQAAPRIQSQDYRAEVVLSNIETALTECQGGTFANGKSSGGEFKVVAGDDKIAQERFYKEAGDDSLVLGKTYGEQLSVRNVGTIPQFVRVTVKKYWIDDKGKRVDLNPAYIKLHFTNTGKWKEDKSAETAEQRVFYYTDILYPSEWEGKSYDPNTVPFTDTLTIDSAVADEVSGKTSEGKPNFTYKGLQFRIQAKVDAVQTHNAKDAMTSAGGRTN